MLQLRFSHCHFFSDVTLERPKLITCVELIRASSSWGPQGDKWDGTAKLIIFDIQWQTCSTPACTHFSKLQPGSPVLRASSHIAIKDLTPCAARDWLNFWDPAQKIWDKFLVYKLNCSKLFVCMCLKIDRISITAACAWTTTAGAADLCAGKRHPWPCNWISSVGTQLRTHTYQRPSTAKYLDLLPLSPDPKKWLSEWHLQACTRAFMVPKEHLPDLSYVTVSFSSDVFSGSLDMTLPAKRTSSLFGFFPF